MSRPDAPPPVPLAAVLDVLLRRLVARFTPDAAPEATGAAAAEVES